MALTSARQILNKKILGGGSSEDVQELKVEVAALSASVQTIGEKVENITEYSTDEHIVGKWIDSSDIYEKTYNNLNVTVTIGDQWCDTGISDSDIAKIIDCNGYDESGQFYCFSAAFLSATHTIGVVMGNNPSERIINCITLRYIKPAPAPESTESKKKTRKSTK